MYQLRVPRTGAAVAVATLAAVGADAQAPPLGRSVSISLGRQPATVLAEPTATRTYTHPAGGTGTERTGARLRSAAQWTQHVDVRWPVRPGSAWAVVGGVSHGTGRGTVLTGVSTTYEPVGTSADSTWRTLDAVTSWRGTLGVSRVLLARRGAATTAQLAGVYGSVDSPSRRACVPSPFAGPVPECSTTPGVRLVTPGAAMSAAFWSPAWHRARLLLHAGSDVLRVNERAAHGQFFRGLTFDPSLPAERPTNRWRTAPTFGVGVAYAP